MATNPLTPRVNNIETGGTWKIGDVKQSFLTEAEFQAAHDDKWGLCDGQDVTGSDYETITGNSTVPDVRGQFLRGKNNGRSDGNENPDGELNPGDWQNEDFKDHNHQQRGNTASGGGLVGFSLNFNVTSATTGTSVNTSNSGGGETRPKNVTVNMFIKINREPSA